MQFNQCRTELCHCQYHHGGDNILVLFAVWTRSMKDNSWLLTLSPTVIFNGYYYPYNCAIYHTTIWSCPFPHPSRMLLSVLISVKARQGAPYPAPGQYCNGVNGVPLSRTCTWSEWCGVLAAVRARRARGEERARRDPDRSGWTTPTRATF